jgi:hypothetical protein
MSTATKTPKKSLARKGVARDPKFTTLENAIISDGVSQGVSKAIAIATLRAWENAGVTPEQIAAVLRSGEGNSAVKGLGKPQASDAATESKFGPTMHAATDSLASGNNPGDDDLDALMAAMGSGRSADDDDDDDRN